MINKEEWKNLVQTQIENMYFAEHSQGEALPQVILQVPPKPEMGDLAFPLFQYAKMFGKNPAEISNELAQKINSLEDKPEGTAFSVGPYMNVRLNMDEMVVNLYKTITSQGENWGKGTKFQDRRVMVEFSGPNTNKPLHLGHVRNDSLGSSISSILQANGAQVYKVNIINNRGIHICKSMLAYKNFAPKTTNGMPETPESTGIKGDHFVGNYYVRFAQWAKNDDTADSQAQEVLQKWEDGDSETRELWQKMNNWTIDGITQTYNNMGISFDRYYYESDTYKLGKDIILDGLERGIFEKAEDGSIFIDNSDIGLDKKILLRKDGTSIYITQDIGTAINRHKDWEFDSMVYVVASEQQYHFKVLFHVLEKLGYSWAKNLYHLSYGMVFLPEGKMKSREGTVVDADDLMEQLTNMAKTEIIEKGRGSQIEDLDKTAHDIALGAVNYYMLQFDPLRDITFNPKESLSFNGNTGPYLQYMGARICSMLEKYDENKYADIAFDSSLLNLEDEREIIKLVASFPEITAKAGEKYSPAVICSYLYELSKNFSRWYHDNQILKAETPALVVARVSLCRMVLQTLKNAFSLIGIPFLSKM